MTRDALLAVGAGLLSAVMAMTFLVGLPAAVLIVYMAPLPLILSGLAMGPRASLISVIAGFFGIGLFGGLLEAGIFSLVHALPAWTMTRLALLQNTTTASNGSAVIDWYPPGPVIGALACLGASLILVAAIMAAGPGLQELVSTHLYQVFTVMAPLIDEGQRHQIITLLAALFPGVAAASWVVMATVNTTLAQALLVRMGHNIRPSPTYAAFELPQWTSLPLVAAATLAFLGTGNMEYIGRNLALVLAVPYFFLGLAIVHSVARRMAMAGLLLVTFYFVIVISGWAALAVVGIGLFEQWIGLRNRFALGGGAPPDDD